MTTALDIIPTGFGDCKFVCSTPYTDHRGTFFETFRFDPDKSPLVFCQINRSISGPRVLRGLHTQRGPNPQGKLISVIRGDILDVVVDLRRGSSTFGRWASYELNEDKNLSLYVPPGYGHGFLTGKRGADVIYACTTLYSDEGAVSLNWDDPQLNINWKLEVDEMPILSEKDANAPLLKDLNLYE